MRSRSVGSVSPLSSQVSNQPIHSPQHKRAIIIRQARNRPYPAEGIGIECRIDFTYQIIKGYAEDIGQPSGHFDGRLCHFTFIAADSGAFGTDEGSEFFLGEVLSFSCFSKSFSETHLYLFERLNGFKSKIRHKVVPKKSYKFCKMER
jgi:hypothetical protein